MRGLRLRGLCRTVELFGGFGVADADAFVAFKLGGCAGSGVVVASLEATRDDRRVGAMLGTPICLRGGMFAAQKSLEADGQE